MKSHTGPVKRNAFQCHRQVIVRCTIIIDVVLKKFDGQTVIGNTHHDTLALVNNLSCRKVPVSINHLIIF